MLRNIDGFINLRRFEGLSLHEVVQGVKVLREATHASSLYKSLIWHR